MQAFLDQVGFVAHLEVWLLVVSVFSLGYYVERVIQPKAEAAGHAAITLSQRLWFVAAALSMWFVSDWPVHDIAENHLYFVHMLQHLMLSMLIPAMFLLATPLWLFELVVLPGSKSWKNIRSISKPLFAGVVFNAATVLLHWSKLVELSAEIGSLHFVLHLLVFATGLLMWMPVIGPVRSWRLPPMGQCIYLFMMSIVPTVPGGWLVFAEDVVYKHYDTEPRLWRIDVLSDQQAAGVVMKLVGGFFLWGVIFLIFTKWAHREMAADEKKRAERSKVSNV